MAKEHSGARLQSSPSRKFDALYRSCFAALFLGVARLLAAAFSNISDCDEVFNYWEATHYLSFGWGMQTWEYSPLYAIRSWTYVLIHSLVGRTLQYFVEIIPAVATTMIKRPRHLVFYLTRAFLATLSTASEYALYSALRTHVNPDVASYYIIIATFSTGMYIASAAYLPSSFAMYFFTFALARSFGRSTRSRPYYVALLVGLAALVGWPFSAAAGIPLVVGDLVLPGRRVRMFKRWTGAIFICALVILVPMIIIDYYFYQRWTIVPLNIVLYNVFGEQGKGPEIFGTEPWWYYLLNLSLNFNAALILAMISGPCVIIHSFTVGRTLDQDRRSDTLNLIMRMLPMYLWMLILTLQPHKEERFMFVIYPLICMNAAIALHHILVMVEAAFTIGFGLRKAQSQRLRKAVVYTFFGLFLSTSLSRTVALTAYYGAPMQVYQALSDHLSTTEHPEVLVATNLCVGKEWYRFPSHYFLPTGVRLRFLQSGFTGLLPKYYNEVLMSNSSRSTTLATGGWEAYETALMKAPRATDRVPSGMNDVNRGEMDRYVDEDACDYIIDYIPPAVEHLPYDPHAREPNYASSPGWEAQYCDPFLDASSTPRISRMLFNPLDSKRRYGLYCFLRRRQ
ncbi:mannosyltransferase [Gaertneriomyces sp. JEL0708]|nr:mannosyltransferase [Gaertneriomyces sp. JEL0708]